MSHFQPVALKHASRLITPGPTVLITSRSADGSRRNVMAAAWSMAVEFEPPRIAVVIDKNTYSRTLIESSGVFGICIPAVDCADLTYAVGSISGREQDKFAHHAIAAINGPVLGLPLIEQNCLAWLECRLIPEPHTQDAYDTCFGEVVSAAADDRVFSHGRWHFRADQPQWRTLHHMGSGSFVKGGEVIQAREPE